MTPFQRVTAVAIASFGTLSPALADVAFNAGAVTDYRYRGISQTRLKPAAQGGLDYSHPSGFYAGAWASTIQWVKDSGGDGRVEIDLYGGYKGQLAEGIGYDVGVLRYQYPSNKLPVNANTDEVYAAVSMGPVTAKYSHAVSNLFGFADSKQSGYLDLSASFELSQGLTLSPHLGRQMVKNNGAYSYTDWSLTLAKDFNGVVLSAAYVDTNTRAYSGARKDLGKGGLVLGLKANF